MLINCISKQLLQMCGLMLSGNSTTGHRSKSKKLDTRAQMMSIELRTPSGTLMRIQGEFDASFLGSIIQGA